jgi:hypothetical protein
MSNKFSARNAPEADKSLRKQAKTLEGRLTALDEGFGRLIVGIDQRFSNIAQALGQHSEVLEALVEHIGADTINALVESKRLERAQQNEEAEKKALADAIADGYMAPAETIGEDSFIVGHELLGNGKPLGTGRQQVAYESLSQDAKDRLLGKSVGATLETPTGGSFEVKEIYRLDKEAARVILSEKARKQAEEAQAAASKDEEKQ